MTTALASYSTALIAAFDARKAYETDKNSANTSIQKTLDDMRKTISNEKIAQIMFASNVDADFINKSERTTARFNVYSAEKVINIARASVAFAQLNHYTRAIFLTAIALHNAKLSMTHADASSACSLDVKTDTKKNKMIVRYQKHIAANTAATQSSSSVNALCMFDVLTETRDDQNNVAYTINSESAATKALCKMMQVTL